MLSRSRYSSEKSSLKRPRKFLIRFLSSSLPRAAMEVAIRSNCPDGFTSGALETVVLLSTRLPIGVALSPIGRAGGRLVWEASATHFNGDKAGSHAGIPVVAGAGV